MKFSTFAFAGFLALAAAQHQHGGSPSSMPLNPPPSGPPAAGSAPPPPGPPGPGAGGFGGMPKGGKGGKGGKGKFSCAMKCLQPVKDAGCQFPFPKKDPGSGPGAMTGPPPGKGKGKSNVLAERQAPPGGLAGGAPKGDRPPRPKIDPEAMRTYTKCLCAKSDLVPSIQACLPKECGDSGIDITPMVSKYNDMCKSVSAAPSGPKMMAM